jgi:hypothetical protein
MHKFSFTPWLQAARFRNAGTVIDKLLKQLLTIPGCPHRAEAAVLMRLPRMFYAHWSHEPGRFLGSWADNAQVLVRYLD